MQKQFVADLTYWRIVRKIKCQMADKLAMIERKKLEREAWEEFLSTRRRLRNVCSRFYIGV